MSLVVVGGPTSPDLTTVEAVKTRNQIAGAEQDELIARLIREASAEVVRFCRRPFARQRVRETVDAEDDGGVMVSLTPVEAVHAVSAGGEPILGVEIDDPGAGVLRGAGSAGGVVGAGEARWWNDSWAFKGKRWVTVEYTGGYHPPSTDAALDALRDLPYDLEGAVIALVGAWLKAEGPAGASPTIRSLKVDDINVTYDDPAAAGSLQTQVYDRLIGYRRVA